MATAIGDKPRDLLTVVRDAALIAAVYLYFVGWTYAFYFYGQFGVSLSALDPPIYYFMIYSFSVLAYYFNLLHDLWRLGFLFLIFVFIGMVVYVVGLHLRRWLLTTMLLVLLPLSYYAARHVGEIQGKMKRIGTYPSNRVRVVFVTKELMQSYPAEFMRANANDELKVLSMTKDKYFVFYQPKGEENAIPYGYTYDIARTDVALVRLEMRDMSSLEVSDETK